MTRQIDPRKGIRNAQGQSSRRHRPLRWILAAVVALVLLVVAAVAVFIKQPALPPLSLPAGAAAAPVGRASGTWQVVAGSVAGFRIPETALGFRNDVVGRTNSVTGAIVIVGDQVTRATLRIGLVSIKVSGKSQHQLARSLGTRQFPSATFTLARPVLLGLAFPSGGTIKVTATGELTMHGATHLVTVRISGRRDGRVLQAAGSIPVRFAVWGIRGPAEPASSARSLVMAWRSFS